jgi:hypothetical protein
MYPVTLRAQCVKTSQFSVKKMISSRNGINQLIDPEKNFLKMTLTELQNQFSFFSAFRQGFFVSIKQIFQCWNANISRPFYFCMKTALKRLKTFMKMAMQTVKNGTVTFTFSKLKDLPYNKIYELKHYIINNCSWRGALHCAIVHLSSIVWACVRRIFAQYMRSFKCILLFNWWTNFYICFIVNKIKIKLRRRTSFCCLFYFIPNNLLPQMASLSKFCHDTEPLRLELINGDTESSDCFAILPPRPVVLSLRRLFELVFVGTWIN